MCMFIACAGKKQQAVLSLQGDVLRKHSKDTGRLSIKNALNRPGNVGTSLGRAEIKHNRGEAGNHDGSERSGDEGAQKQAGYNEGTQSPKSLPVRMDASFVAKMQMQEKAHANTDRSLSCCSIIS